MLSGYAGPGSGEQTILGSTLLSPGKSGGSLKAPSPRRGSPAATTSSPPGADLGGAVAAPGTGAAAGGGAASTAGSRSKPGKRSRPNRPADGRPVASGEGERRPSGKSTSTTATRRAPALAQQDAASDPLLPTGPLLALLLGAVALAGVGAGTARLVHRGPVA